MLSDVQRHRSFRIILQLFQNPVIVLGSKRRDRSFRIIHLVIVLGSKRDAGTSKAVAEAVGEDEGVLRCLIICFVVVCVGDTVCFDVVKWSHSGVYGVGGENKLRSL